MKRQYVIPDLLASITAEALFGGRVNRRPDEPAPAQPSPGALKRFASWVRANGAPAANRSRPTARMAAPPLKEER